MPDRRFLGGERKGDGDIEMDEVLRRLRAGGVLERDAGLE